MRFQIYGGSFVHTSAMADFENCLYDGRLITRGTLGFAYDGAISYDGFLILKKLDM